MARPRSDLRERILVAARREFLAVGVAGTPLRAIARRARTNLGMIYYYFPSKDALFLAVIEEPYARIVATIAAALEGDAPVRERIRALYRRIGAFTPEEAETFRLVISEALTSPARRAAVLARAWHGHLPVLVGAVQRGQREHALAPGVPTPLLAVVTAALGLLPQVAARAFPMGVASGDALADQLVDLLFDGVGTRPPRR